MQQICQVDTVLISSDAFIYK